MPRTKGIHQSKDTLAAQGIPHPVVCREGRGVRYFDCPHYDVCLDKAAKALWTGFTCAYCFFYQHQPRPS
ncbi:MAG: hypothetical protein WHS46_06975 [Desulfosoma sp.]